MKKKGLPHPMTLDEIRSSMTAAALSGDIGKQIKDRLFERSDFFFAESPKGAEFLDKVYRDGRRVTGRTVDNKWIEVVG